MRIGADISTCASGCKLEPIISRESMVGSYKFADTGWLNVCGLGWAPKLYGSLAAGSASVASACVCASVSVRTIAYPRVFTNIPSSRYAG